VRHAAHPDFTTREADLHHALDLLTAFWETLGPLDHLINLIINEYYNWF
jgi:hypothetical protein